MSESLNRISSLSPKRLALLAQKQQRHIEELESRAHPDIAIVGIGCRLPGGVRDPASFWTLLSEGIDTIEDVPKSRWNLDEFYDPDPLKPGKMSTRWGSFLGDPALFDARFFGIAPIEAEHMDPQQRLLLEVTWEAMENAGISASSLEGTKTGVFVGICTSDYRQMVMRQGHEAIDPYIASGTSHAVAAGRLSYVFGLQGPSVAVDTACSSSLVAVHMACQSLRLGESEQAFAAGVNLILSPEVTIALSRSRMMAADGRCKTFDHAADGFVRGEGCGVILLKRLPDALRDRDRVMAVIRGSAINQDGRSSGITAPNGPSQEAVLRSALQDAHIRPDEVDYIEAHGTGTALGDPIELRALGETFAVRERKLIVGSVKTNLGHLESAAGIAGVIKAVISLQHAQIPASLHFCHPNPLVDWAKLPIHVPTRLEHWSSQGRPRIAGVSSFGFGGTNAHVVLEEAPVPVSRATRAQGPQLVTLSARSESALLIAASQLDQYLTANPTSSLDDIALTLNVGRDAMERRLAIVADSTSDLQRSLKGFAEGSIRAVTYIGHASSASPRACFVCAGHGAYAGMCRDLYRSESVFRTDVDASALIFEEIFNLQLQDILYGNDGLLLTEARYMNPVLFVIEHALIALWRSWGVEPDAVDGDGVGEYVAACVAGVFTVKDALTLINARYGPTSDLKAMVAQISYQKPRIPRLSEAGDLADTAAWSSADFWMRQASQTIESGNLRPLAKSDGFAAYLEIVQSVGSDPLPEEHNLNRRRLLEHVAALYVLGFNINWERFQQATRGLRIDLPGYPFERTRFWFKPVKSPHIVEERAFQGATVHRQGQIHPLLGRLLDTALPTFEAIVGPQLPLGLQDHCVKGSNTAPAAVWINLPLTAANELGWAHRTIADLTISAPMIFDPTESVHLQTVLRHTTDASNIQEPKSFEIYSRRRGENKWILHARGTLLTVNGTVFPEAPAVPPLVDSMSGEAYYKLLSDRGYLFGPAFRGVSKVSFAPNWANAFIDRSAISSQPYTAICDPAVLDVCLQSIGAAAMNRDDGKMRLLHSAGQFTLHRQMEPKMSSLAWIESGEGQGDDILCNLQIRSQGGELIALVSGVVLRSIEPHVPVSHVSAKPSDWLYEMSWEPKPDAVLASNLGSLIDNFALCTSQADLQTTGRISDLLDGLCANYILDAIQPVVTSAFGVEPFTQDQLQKQLEIDSNHIRLFKHLIAILIEDGCFYLRGDLLYQERRAVDPEQQVEELRAQFPQFEVETRLLRRCASRLLEVLQGRCDPVQLLFPNGSMADTEHIYRNSELAKSFNKSIASFVEHVVDSISGRPIRILEIGAGTGSTTQEVLAILTDHSVTYDFTDVSPAFLRRAREKFAGHPFVTYRLLDIDQDPISQGFLNQSYDLIIAVNVLHATPDLRRTLKHVSGLAVAGAALVLLEGTAPNRWGDLTFGLTDGWWLFRDADLRPAYPLVDEHTWLRILSECGFDRSRSLSYPMAGGTASQQKLILARRSGIVDAHAREAQYVIIPDCGKVAAHLQSLLRQAGLQCTLLEHEAGDQGLESLSVWTTRNPDIPVDVINLSPLDLLEDFPDSASLETASKGIMRSCINLIRMLGEKHHDKSRQWLITRGAQASLAVSCGNAIQAMIWGIGRVLALETPQRLGAMIDVDPDGTDYEAAEAVFDSLLCGDSEDQVAYRAGVRMLARLKPARVPDTEEVRFVADATYLITGGLGGLGLSVAQWAIERGARHLVLIGRSALPTPEKAEAAERLRLLGADVKIIAADVASLRDMERVFALFSGELPKLRGVFHLAADISVSSLGTLSDSMIEAMLRPKVFGTWVLHEFTKDLDLDFLVAFSSSTSLLGSGAMAHYAAANQFIDCFAGYRHALGLPMLSVNWGTWETMERASAAEREAVERSGLRPMPAPQAFKILAKLITSSSTQIMVADVAWHTLIQLYEMKRPRPFLSQLKSLTFAQPIAMPVSRQNTDDANASASINTRDQIQELVQKEAADVLGMSAETLPLDLPLASLGLDSLMAMDLRNRLVKLMDRDLPSTIAFDHPSIMELAREIDTRMLAAREWGERSRHSEQMEEFDV